MVRRSSNHSPNACTLRGNKANLSACFWVLLSDMPQLEFGDKIVLPQVSKASFVSGANRFNMNWPRRLCVHKQSLTVACVIESVARVAVLQNPNTVAVPGRMVVTHLRVVENIDVRHY